MYYENKLTANFSSNSVARKAKEILAESLHNGNFDADYADSPSERMAEDLKVKGSKLILEENGYYTPETVLDVFKAIWTDLAKAISEEEFSFETYAYCDYSEMEVNSEYGNGNLKINSTYYPMGYTEYVCCPECGEEVCRIDEFDPSKSYACEECGEEVDLTNAYEEVAPIVKGFVIEIK